MGAINFDQQQDTATAELQQMQTWADEKKKSDGMPWEEDTRLLEYAYRTATTALKGSNFELVDRLYEVAQPIANGHGDPQPRETLRQLIDTGFQYESASVALTDAGIIEHEFEDLQAGESRVWKNGTLTIPNNITAQEAYDFTVVADTLVQRSGQNFYNWDDAVTKFFSESDALKFERPTIEGLQPVPNQGSKQTISQKDFEGSAKDRQNFYSKGAEIQNQLYNITLQLPYYTDKMEPVREALRPLLQAIQELQKASNEMIQLTPSKATARPTTSTDVELVLHSNNDLIGSPLVQKDNAGYLRVVLPDNPSAQQVLDFITLNRELLGGIDGVVDQWLADTDQDAQDLQSRSPSNNALASRSPGTKALAGLSMTQQEVAAQATKVNHYTNQLKPQASNIKTDIASLDTRLGQLQVTIIRTSSISQETMQTLEDLMQQAQETQRSASDLVSYYLIGNQPRPREVSAGGVTG